MRKSFLLCLFLWAVPAAAQSTYYIAANGLDTNSGTSKGSPWLHAPGMTGCSNTCAAASPVPGDSFIFRGGDTWHYGNSALTPYVGGTSPHWNWNWAGSATTCNLDASAGAVTTTTCIYVGVDKTWFTGGSWTRPIMNMDNALTTSQPSSCTYNMAGNNMLFLSKQYIIFDNFEWVGLCWAGNPNSGIISMFANNQQVTNNYFHGWSNTSTYTDQFLLIGGNGIVANIIDHNVFDGSDSSKGGLNSGKATGKAVGAGTEIAFNIFWQVSNGLVEGNQAYNIHDNLFYYLVEPSDPGGTHGNIVEQLSPLGSSQPSTYFFNNLFYITGEGEGIDIYSDATAGGAMYVFNNVSWFYRANLTNPPTNSTNSGDCYLWEDTGGVGATQPVNFFNNTVDYPCFANQKNITLTQAFENNHFIGFSPANLTAFASSPTTDNGGQLFQTEAVANGQGYVTTNNYAPTSGGSTIGAGNNMTSFCNAISNSIASAACKKAYAGVTYNQMTHAAVPNTPTSRPASGAWDSGAYQFAAPTPPHGPQSYTAPTDVANHIYTRSSTPPAQFTWFTDPDFLHSQKSTLFPAATDNGTAQFLCGSTSVVTQANAIEGSSFPLNSVLWTLSASQAAAWSTDNKYVIVTSSSGGRDLILKVDVVTPRCDVAAMVDGASGTGHAGGMTTAGGDPTPSKTEPNIWFGSAVSGATTLQYNIQTNTSTTLANWPVEATFPTGLAPTGTSSTVDTIPDIVGYGHDPMVCVSQGISGETGNTQRYTLCKWLPTGSIAWLDAKFDNTGGNGLPFGPLGLIPPSCTTPLTGAGTVASPWIGHCTGIVSTPQGNIPANCESLAANRVGCGGLHGVGACTNGTQIYALSVIEGVDAVLWQPGTLLASPTTPTDNDGHHTCAGPQFIALSGGPATGGKIQSELLNNPTVPQYPDVPRLCLFNAPTTNKCDDQHNSGVAVSPTGQGLMTSGDYYFLLAQPPSASNQPNGQENNEISAITLDGLTKYRFTHTMNNAAYACTLSGGNCMGVGNFFDLVNGNPSDDGSLYVYSSNYNGAFGLGAGSKPQTGIFVMEMQAGSSINPIAPAAPSFVQLNVVAGEGEEPLEEICIGSD